MCFRFDACFGAVPDNDDDHCGASAKASPPHHHRHHDAAAPVKTATTAPHHPPPAHQRNGHQHQHGVAHHGNYGYKAPHHHQLPAAAAADEEDRKASNDLRKRHAPAPAPGAATTKGHAAGAEDTFKQTAMTAKVVADGEGRHGARYYFHESEPAAHREGAAADHGYSTTATTTPSTADYGR